MKKLMLRRWVLPILCTLLFGMIWFYLKLPPINIKSLDFWILIGVLAIVFLVIKFLFCLEFMYKEGFKKEDIYKNVNAKIGYFKIPMNFRKSDYNFKFIIKIVLILVVIIIVGGIVVWVTSSEIFNAKAYHDQMQVVEGNFQEDISEVPLSQIPIVDKATAIKLGNRELGEMADLVSQFEISDIYTQINYNNSQIRVSPLMYGDLIKWFTNQGDGIPYYVKINIATQETNLVKTQDPIKYSPYEHFSRYLKRHLRFLYPFDMFETPVFELDDTGRPFWVVPVYEYEIGVIGGKDIVSVIVVDAATGESQKYNIGEVPQWIDNVFPAKLLNIQANNWGKYSNGWVNSIFSQRNVVTTASGYNSIVLNGDLWMYTGLTSVTDDQSNVGYILSNMRTKETKFYQIKGANEESAMRSAEGKVQEKKYNATFPILVNIADKPTYFLSLKDDAGLIKQFAFVCAEQYQIVGVGDSLLLAQNAYIQQLKANGANVYEESNFKAGNIIDINMAVVDGNTNYYFKLKDEPNLIFVAPISVSYNLPFIKTGDYVEIKYTERDSSENLKTINEIKIVM